MGKIKWGDDYVEKIEKLYKEGLNARQIAKEIGLPRTTIMDIITREGLTKNSLALVKPPAPAQGDSLLLLSDEALDSLKNRRDYHVGQVQKVGELLLDRIKEELASNPELTPQDLALLSKATKDANDTLQAIPRAPAIAQQFNFARQQNKDAKIQENEIVISYEFLDSFDEEANG